MESTHIHSIFKPATFFLFFFLIFTQISLFGQIESGDFPITEYKSTTKNATQIIYVSGDGGMNEFSRSVCKNFQNRGYSVIAIDSKKYFWKAKTPEVFTNDMTKIVRHYEKLWQGDSFVLIGYSFGADVIAFLPNKFPENIAKQLRLSALIDPSATTEFEIKFADMLGRNSDKGKYSTINEINAMKIFPLVCMMSSDEDNHLVSKIVNKKIQVQLFPGDHRFNNDYDLLVSSILSRL